MAESLVNTGGRDKSALLQALVGYGGLENWALNNMPSPSSRESPFNSQPFRQPKPLQIPDPRTYTFPALPDTVS